MTATPDKDKLPARPELTDEEIAFRLNLEIAQIERDLQRLTNMKIGMVRAREIVERALAEPT